MSTLEELRERRDKLVADLSETATTSRVMLQSPATRREIEYRSVEEIKKAIELIDREIAQRDGRRPRTFLPTFSKGL